MSQPPPPPGPIYKEFGYRYYPTGTLKGVTPQSVVVSPSSDPLETGVFRSALSASELVSGFGPKIKTVNDLFEHGVALNPNGPALGVRHASINPSSREVTWGPYKWLSYTQVARSRQLFGCGLNHIYLNRLKGKPEDKWNLGIFSINRPEWVVADLGAQAFGVPVVALYDTLGPDTSEFIINHSDIPVLVSAIERIPQVLKFANKCPKLKVIIALDPVPAGIPSPGINTFAVLKAWAADKGILLYSFAEVIALGEKNIVPFRLPREDDVFCVCYTSGTTGNPKGAMLTHRNMISTQRAASVQTPIEITDVHISYLPLAHIFERVVLLHVLFKGGAAGFYRGDTALLVEDIGILKPTLFISVPRLLNRIYDKINQGALHSGSALKATLFKTALDAKVSNLRNSGILTHSLWDPLVFNKVKGVLGGRVRLIFSASAPISGETMEFLRVVFGCEVVEAYGQTECNGGLTVSWPCDYTKAHVGSVLPNMELKLVSVPEMNYHAKDLKGEVWCRGPGVFKGYLKDEAKTKEALTSDGWLMTGDIGSLDKAGRLSIVDRKKNIFKLAQGEYVAPEKLENTFVKSGFVAQIYVHGDSLQSELVAIVVPDPEYSVTWAVSKGVLPPNTPVPVSPQPGQPTPPIMFELCKKDVFKAAIIADLAVFAKEDKLRGFEFIRAITLEPEAFSTENNLLTPTFKLKRADAAKKYRAALDDLYKIIEATAKKSKL